jgi:hypothetical protein
MAVEAGKRNLGRQVGDARSFMRSPTKVAPLRRAAMRRPGTLAPSMPWSPRMGTGTARWGSRSRGIAELDRMPVAAVAHSEQVIAVVTAIESPSTCSRAPKLARCGATEQRRAAGARDRAPSRRRSRPRGHARGDGARALARGALGPLTADCCRSGSRILVSMSEPQFVAVAEGSMSYIKELVQQCERAGIVVSLDRCRSKS